MKQFLKFTLATIVGLIITSFLGMLIFFGMIGAIAASSEKTVKTTPNSVYELELNGQLVERSKDDPFSSLLAGSFGQSAVKAIGLDDILSNIRKAKNDNNILGIYLNGGMLSGGYASFTEVETALVLQRLCGEKLTLKDLATYFGYSESYFYRLFFKEIQYAPVEYFNQLKIQRACQLLKSTNMKISQIAVKLAFDDPYYFSRIFKKTVGKSPKSYRQSDDEWSAKMLPAR